MLQMTCHSQLKVGPSAASIDCSWGPSKVPGTESAVRVSLAGAGVTVWCVELRVYVTELRAFKCFRC